MNDKEIIVKAWEVNQNLIKDFGNTCWKIRSISFSLSAAMIAYAYINTTPVIYIFTSPISVAFMLLEAGYRRLQQQCIAKSIGLEQTINDILAGEDEPRLPNDGISTSFYTPDLKSFFRQFALKRFLFWLPYLIIATLGCVLFMTELKSEQDVSRNSEKLRVLSSSN